MLTADSAWAPQEALEYLLSSAVPGDLLVKQVVSQQSLENHGGTHTYTAAGGGLPATAGKKVP